MISCTVCETSFFRKFEAIIHCPRYYMDTSAIGKSVHYVVKTLEPKMVSWLELFGQLSLRTFLIADFWPAEFGSHQCNIEPA